MQANQVRARIVGCERAGKLDLGVGRVSQLHGQQSHRIEQLGVPRRAREQAAELIARLRVALGRHQASRPRQAQLAVVGGVRDSLLQVGQSLVLCASLLQDLRLHQHCGRPAAAQLERTLDSRQRAHGVLRAQGGLGASDVCFRSVEVGLGQPLNDASYGLPVRDAGQCTIQAEQVLRQAFARLRQHACELDLHGVEVDAVTVFAALHACEHAPCFFRLWGDFRPDACCGARHLQVACVHGDLGRTAGDARIARAACEIEIELGRQPDLAA